jgi:superfamily II DNA or RNA helicase/HKD family nuclease
MLDVVRQALRTADRIAISVSFLRCSGLSLVVDDIQQFGERGGEVRFLTSTYMSVTQPEALRALCQFRAVKARLQMPGHGAVPAAGFHTKIYAFWGTRRECWVGSSNFSKGGLSTNIEANLRHLGTAEFGAVEDLFEGLWNRPDTQPLDEDVIGFYEASRPKQIWIRAGDGPDAPTPALQEPQAINVTSVVPKPNAAQHEALERLAALRDTGESRAVVIAAPGIGKTYLAAFDAFKAGAQRVLFLSHRLEHLTQAKRTFQSVFGANASYSEFYGGRGAASDFVFGTIQSVSNDLAMASREYDYVVIDEFHHAAAPSYRRLLDQLRPRFLLGLTATPERQDGHDVLRLCDYNVAYEVRLVQAINRGWLLPFHYFGIADSTVNYNSIPWRSGRFDPDALEHALMVNARVNEMLRHCLERGFDGPRRATVGFCAGIRHAEFMAKTLRTRGLVAESVTGAQSIDERERIYRRFADVDDPLEWLFVADVLNEGVDIPAINSLVFLRPTESATIFIQQLGRGLRLSPGCEVLTVLDFVGHHRKAWIAVEALADRDAPPGPSTVAELDLTPPVACEIVLSSKTKEILEKVRRHSQSRKGLCLEIYHRLREELGVSRPYPVDLISIPESVSMSDIRTTFGSWIDLRRAAGDALSWELNPDSNHPTFQLLAATERDWQATRVYPYAALWGLCARPDAPEAGYEDFFVRFPRWRVEHRALRETKAIDTLDKKLGGLSRSGSIDPRAFALISRDDLLKEIEGRLQLVLEKDYRLRHGGVIRRPKDLVLHRTYARSEIVNHFGLQYSPARDNSGMLRFSTRPDHIVLIAKLDTTGAADRFRFSNSFVKSNLFNWVSQNQQTRTNSSGLEVLEHKERGVNLHLFVQRDSHSKPLYCGLTEALSDKATGDAPMTVPLKLLMPLTDALLQSLGLEVTTGDQQ